MKENLFLLKDLLQLLKLKSPNTRLQYQKMCSLINSIENVNNKLGEYEKDFMKIKSNSDDHLPLNKTLKLHNMTIIIRSVFEEDGKYYPKVY